MHLKNPLLFGLMAILLLGGTITPVLSQSSPDLGIVINEVELKSNSGSAEYVELYNSTDNPIDIGGWTIAPTATWKTLEIPSGTIIDSKSFLIFSHVNFWFKDFGEIISLYDNNGKLIDETPLLVDQDNTPNSWQRTTDGFDTDSIDDWISKRITPKSSNGIITETQESTFTFLGKSDKAQYIFGDSVIISGSISEKLFNQQGTPEIIKISIQGPNYSKNHALFADRDLNFSTSFTIQKVLGFKEGEYDVVISYGEHNVNTTFSITDESLSTSDVSESEMLKIMTDRESYIPGETVLLSAETNSSIEYGGLDYVVKNPNGDIVFSGTIFPNTEFSVVHKQGSGQIFPFSTNLFMSAVDPVYGTYTVDSIYKSQNPRYYSSENTLNASTSFDFVEDVKENVLISLSTDKEIYSVGDIIKVTGRSNDIWVEDLELFAVQTGLLSSGAVGADSRYVAPDPFELRDRVRLNGDGTFNFEFAIVADSGKQENYSKYFGDYKITVSEYFGDASVFFKVVEDPDTFTDIRTPMGLKTDSSEYILGSALKISGKVMNYDHAVTNNMRNSIDITFTDPSGKVLMYQDHSQRTGYTNCNTNDCDAYNTPLVYRAMPNLVGAYEINAILTPLQFDYGVYKITASYPHGKLTESLEFEIKSAQEEIIEKIDQEPLTMQICKSDRTHVDEILKDLKSIGKGEIAPSMESVDCSDNLTFEIGDKLVVTGKIIPKTGIELDQSSTKTSGQTQGGSSYSTNYAQAIMNYVEVSIPYPKSMTITKSTNYVTTPDDDENYTGGGGQGGGGVAHGGSDGTGTTIGSEYGDDQAESKRQTGYDGTAVLKKQKLMLTDMRYKAYPDSDGNFATVFELRAGVFNDGVYAVKADYSGYHEETSVRIIDNSLKGGMAPNITVNLEKDEFVAGETVRINGLVENIYYFDSVSVKIETPDTSKINCFEGAQCGFGNTEKKLRIIEGVSGSQFNWNYKIPEFSSSIGKYTIVVDTHFGEFKKDFFVVDESEIIGQSEKPSSITKKIIEKFNRISDNEIPIALNEKSSEESTLVPRVLQGSLFTSARGEESDVNLRVSTADGQCIIGQDSNCLVSESTRKPGAIYSIVSIDDVNYKIRYSGNDVRLEKFSIVPEESNSQIDIDNWKVEIIKDEQPTRFYYKVSYIALE